MSAISQKDAVSSVHNGVPDSAAGERSAGVALPLDRLERVAGWGMAVGGMGYVYRPSTIDGVAQVFEIARRTGRTVGLRGGGNSYGDAALNSENIILDLTRMNRILVWDPSNGRVTVEPGVTIQQLWRYAIGDGWWPPVVTGTSFATVGGCAAMNVHGKNNFKAGPIGDHILEFDALLPTGEHVHCSRDGNTDLFYGMIGGFGALGCFTSVTLQMKKIYSGWLNVDAISVPHMDGMLYELDARKGQADYLVGWSDAFASGETLGRGQIHQATYLAPGDDPYPAQSLRIESQEIPANLFGFLPASIIWLFMKPVLNDWGTRLTNLAKYMQSATLGNHKRYRQSHVAFAFLLDYVPNWKLAYQPGGLIQYQSFLPLATASPVYREILARSQKRGVVPYLGVVKRHRPDDFLINYSVDGYSLALDYKVTGSNRASLTALLKELDRIVIAGGGKFYFAKDATLQGATVRAFLGEERIRKFGALKERCDPESLLQTDLYRRLFGDQ
ncbi:MAG: FAD-binding oxidoreductase [Chloroflexi bacterium]|nr:FAD-binding oxidoreductase [Chloroflexota bacterium]